MTDKDEPTSASARPGDPSTSHDAAERTRQSHLEEAVFTFMWPNWPRYMTTIEIAEKMGIDKWSVSPRMKPLHDKGWLDDPIKRPGRNSAGHIRELQAWRVRRFL